MKLNRILLLGLIHSLLMTPNVGALEDNSTVPQMDEVTEERSISRVEELTQYLGELKTIPSYKMQIKLVNQRSNETKGKITIYGNQATGNMIIDYDFFDRLSNPNHHAIRLYAYDHFKYVYASTLDWLNSMDYFSQPYFKRDDAQIMSSIKAPLVELDNENIMGIKELTNLVDGFLLLPNLTKLKEVSEDQLFYVDPIYTMNLERTEIPELIFSDTNNLQLKLTTDFNLKQENVSAIQKLDLSILSGGLAFEALVNQEMDQQRLRPIEGLNPDRVLPDMLKDLSVATTLVTKKLTDFDIAYNRNTSRYTLSLAGVTENFNINIFADKTASFKSYEFKTVYTFEPTEWEMPELLDLNAISQNEFNYLLTKELGDEVIED